MTDGIIQQIFNKRIQTLRAQSLDYQSPVIRGKYNYAITHLAQIEQELIEKIKQEQDRKTEYVKTIIPDLNGKISIISISFLIGDNE